MYEDKTKVSNNFKKYSLKIAKLYNKISNIKKDLSLKDRIYKCEICRLEGDRGYIASINLHNKLPRIRRRIHRKVTPVEITALNLPTRLTDLTSIVEAGIKHYL